MTVPAPVPPPPPLGKTPEPLLDMTLPCDPASVPAARHAIQLQLRGKDQHAGRVDTVLLLATEVLTNAMCNADGPVRLHVADGKGPVRVEVTDGSSDPPVLRDEDTEATNGRGLLLIDELATEWGHRPVAGGKTVWFIVD